MSQKTGGGKVSSGRRTAGLIGGLAFAIGFILALVCGIVARDNGGVALVLVILGIVVALLNISAREIVPVMVAAIALIVAGGANIFTPLDTVVDGLGESLNGIVTYLAIFMVPVAIISAVRAVVIMARPSD